MAACTDSRLASRPISGLPAICPMASACPVIDGTVARTSESRRYYGLVDKDCPPREIAEEGFGWFSWTGSLVAGKQKLQFLYGLLRVGEMDGLHAD